MEKVQISKRDVIHTVSGVLYEMSPSHKPRRIDEIIEQCCKFCDERIGNEYLIKERNGKGQNYEKRCHTHCQWRVVRCGSITQASSN